MRCKGRRFNICVKHVVLKQRVELNASFSHPNHPSLSHPNPHLPHQNPESLEGPLGLARTENAASLRTMRAQRAGVLEVDNENGLLHFETCLRVLRCGRLRGQLSCSPPSQGPPGVAPTARSPEQELVGISSRSERFGLGFARASVPPARIIWRKPSLRLPSLPGSTSSTWHSRTTHGAAINRQEKYTIPVAPPTCTV